MEYLTFIIIVILIEGICGLVNLIMWIMDANLSLVCTVIMFLLLPIFLVMHNGISTKQANREPIETSFEVIETYTPADGNFKYCHYIDKGILKVQAETWVLEISDGEYEFFSGDYSVELCQETKTYKYGFIKKSVGEKYYKVYVPGEEN